MAFVNKAVFKYKCCSLESLHAVLQFPKIVLFENLRSFRIVDLEVKEEGIATDPGIKYQLDDNIIDKTMQDQFLWLILQSGKLLVIDVYNGDQLKIMGDNYLNIRLKRFERSNGLLLLISESGEQLNSPFNSAQLMEKFEEGHKELTVCFKKTDFYPSKKLYNIKNEMNNISLNATNGNIVIECPVTGLTQVLYTDASVEHVVPWNDVVLVTGGTSMWTVNLMNANILHEFENVEKNYYPLEASNDCFYYILWDQSEVHIYGVWPSTTQTGTLIANSHNFSDDQFASQGALKLQLQSLVESAISSSDLKVLPELKEYFEKIEDCTFLLDIAFQLCHHSISYKLILSSLHKKIFESGDNALSDILSDLMIKIDLLEYILFRGNTAYDDINLFDQNYKQLCVTFISNSDFDLASICWLKYSEINLKVLGDDVQAILNAIPQNIKLGALNIWLKIFAPSVLNKNPYFIDIFVKWTTERVFVLEQSIYWPKIGLKFIDEMINILESSSKTISLRPISVDDLDLLKDHIIYIMELKDKYKINLLLGEISSLSPGEVALIMLRRCYTEDLESLLQNYLPQYATRYLFELDDTLRSFIEMEAATCGGGVDSSRLKIILESFRLPTNKLDCLLQVLKVLDVPWDDTILDVAVASATSVFKDFTVTNTDRDLATEIQNELNYAKVKVVLKKYNFPLICTDYNLVIHKVLNATCVNLDDLKTITNVTPALSSYANLLFVERCLRDCETRLALNYFHSMSVKEKKALIKTAMNKFELIVNGNTNNKVLERNYLDFLKGSQALDDQHIKNMDKLYHLKHSYDVVLNCNDLNNERLCTDLASEWILKNTSVTASSGRGQCVMELTCGIQTQTAALIALLHRSSIGNEVRKIIENLISRDQSEAKVSSILSEFKDGANSNLLLDSYNVLVDLVTQCSEDGLHSLVFNLSVLNTLINTNITVKNLSMIWKFHYIFLPMSSVTAANDFIDFFCSSQSKMYSISPEIMNKGDFIAFRILAVVLDKNLSGTETFEVKHCAVRKLLSKVVTSQEFDEILLTCLLLVLNESITDINKAWVLDLLQGQNESLPPYLLCYLNVPIIRKTFSLDDIPGSPTSYPPHYILKSKFNINLQDIALPDCTEETWDAKLVLFYVLRQYPETTFERLFELCFTLNVSINDGLSLLLVSLLTTWELNYKILTSDLGCREIQIHNNEQSLTLKCLTIWEEITDKEFLKSILYDLWISSEVTLHGRLVSINPYYYEVYLSIYHLIYGSSAESRNKKEYFLLHFLKGYRRKSTPKQYEFELFSVKGMFPEIGNYRLPFHLFMREDMWSNLKSEITLETYERWLPAVKLLSLDSDSQTAKDMICSNAVKQTMTERKRNDVVDDEGKDNEPWRLTSREEPLLRAAHRCVRHIANMEWAAACLFYVLQGCARGADQVAAAHLCYQFAQRWAALQPGNRAVRQMQRLHATLSTRHALHKIDWAREEFLRLTSEPTQLIRAMYLHPNFVEKMNRHDVNRAANEIADKNGINISSIRIQILENILTKSGDDNKNKDNAALDTNKLMTAKYILKETCPKMGAIYLSRIAFDDESDFIKCKKLRALQCLMSVIDPDTALKVTNMDRDSLWPALLELLYTINLENIDMPWIAATFVQDKVRALEQLLQVASGGNVEVLKITADLAKRFGNDTIIRNILPHLLHVSLFEETVPLLLKLTSPPDQLIYNAWRAVILSPFQRADYPITERQKFKCLNAINLLPMCPVVKDSDLIEIWKNCLRCKCLGLGCLILPYLSPEARENLNELKKIDRRNLIASLKNLQSETYLASGALYVVESMARIYR